MELTLCTFFLVSQHVLSASFTVDMVSGLEAQFGNSALHLTLYPLSVYLGQLAKLSPCCPCSPNPGEALEPKPKSNQSR